jgi:type IV secretory pathway VirB2 component (pilin)
MSGVSRTGGSVNNEGWLLACLAVMAVALVAMAIGQVVLALTAARMARQANETIQQFQRDVRPILDKVQKIADDAQKTSGLVAVQVERFDVMMEASAKRLDETLKSVQEIVAGPVRQGAAIVAAIRAAVELFQGVREGRKRAPEDDDALFIG